MELYLKFKDQNLVISIRKRRFKHYKPWYAKKLKDKSLCCCKMHIEFDLERQALNDLRSAHVGKLLHGDKCPWLPNECSISSHLDPPLVLQGKQVWHPKVYVGASVLFKDTNCEWYCIKCIHSTYKYCDVKR